jgi:hypothetical protein
MNGDTPAPAEQKAQGSYVEMPVPQGWQPPETDGSNNGEFEIVDTWRMKPDGKTLCLVRFGDMRMKTKDEKPNYKSMANSIVSSMGAEQGGGGEGGMAGGY